MPDYSANGTGFAPTPAARTPDDFPLANFSSPTNLSEILGSPDEISFIKFSVFLFGLQAQIDNN